MSCRNQRATAAAPSPAGLGSFSKISECNIAAESLRFSNFGPFA